MRLAGISEFAIRAARASGASAGEKVGSAETPKGVRGEDRIGVSTVLGSTEVTPTFDAERVAEIRKAIEDGRYPLVPAKIADALIAAKLYGIVGA
ncbi:MAG: flagellar biosynthesis anti-sigma factor FlgM [Sphingomonadales bacterium]|nr:MAG: flagellar biosynthesis anti-sigma factor FlgM [Sphingomonadales bacterium]